MIWLIDQVISIPLSIRTTPKELKTHDSRLGYLLRDIVRSMELTTDTSFFFSYS